MDFNREEAYRIYVTRSLQLIPQNRYIQTTYSELLKPKKVDQRSADEILTDVMEKAGLKFEV